MTKLLFLAGSAAKSSLNKTLTQYACQKAAEKDVDATFIDLKNYEMPLYCGDWEFENGMPECAKQLKILFSQCDGFYITSPEYNGTFTPLLKNTIDWLSRPMEQGDKLSAYKGKIAAIASTSPGPLGGLRGLTHLRTLLSDIGVHVIPSQIAIGGGTSNFDDNGQLITDRYIAMIDAQIDQFIDTARKLNA